jgi:hypothetical protein
MDGYGPETCRGSRANDMATFNTILEATTKAPEGQGSISADLPHTVFSAFEGTRKDLHKWLEEQCTGDSLVLTIPRDPDFRWDRRYWGRNCDGTPLTQEIVERGAPLAIKSAWRDSPSLHPARAVFSPAVARTPPPAAQPASCAPPRASEICS